MSSCLGNMCKETCPEPSSCHRRTLRPKGRGSQDSQTSSAKSEERHGQLDNTAGTAALAWPRYRIFGVMTVIFFARGTSLLLPALGPKILLAHVGLASVPLIFAWFTAAGDYKVWHDVIFCLAGFLMLLYMTRVTVPIYANMFPAAEPRNGILGFILWEHCYLLMGVHPVCLAIFDVIVVLFCPVGNGNFSGKIDLALVFAVIMITNVLLERTRAEASRATAEVMKARTLTEQRQKRQLEQCIALVFQHVKSPLLLAKSEVSVNQDAKKAVRCASARIQQIWTMLNGLQREIEREFNVRFLSEDGKSQQLDEMLSDDEKAEETATPPPQLHSLLSSPVPSSAPLPSADELNRWLPLPSKATLAVALVMDDSHPAGYRPASVDIHIPAGSQGTGVPWQPLFASDEQSRFLHWLVQSSNSVFNGNTGDTLDEDLFFELPLLCRTTLKSQNLCVRSTVLDDKNQISVTLEMSQLSFSDPRS